MIKLKDLPKGSIFQSQDGKLAVKTAFCYSGGEPQCISLSDGECIHFTYEGEANVSEIDIQGLVKEIRDLKKQLKDKNVPTSNVGL